MLRRAPIALALLSWPLSCCCDDPECGDDARDPGELCYEDDPAGQPADVEQPYALRVGRFDADEHPDILVVGLTDDRIHADLLRGDGDGGFEDPRRVTVDGCSAYPIAGDLDADGRDDLVFGTCTQGLAVYFSAEDGSFGPAVVLPVLLDLRQIAVVDVDGDGRRDILALGVDGSGAPALSFAQSVDGGFAPAFVTPQPVPSIPEFAPVAMLAARRERDGGFEVLLTQPGRRNAVARTRYDGDARFGVPLRVDVDLIPRGLAMRDLDGDDNLDLLVGDADAGEVVTFFTNENDRYIPGPRTFIGDAEWQSLTLAHLDDDGWLDLAVARDTRVKLYRGGGDGSFEHGADLTLPAPVVELVLYDLNADARADLVAGTFAADDPITIVLSGP
ncbi:MAG: VCBS repeat-containing protein [Myxococcales bacterium]|nr:VCBS repeat-containing protein [Myxococcales bacterium]